MKTLIINGSPRKNGDTLSLINEFHNHLQGEIITISTFYDEIKPCCDCRYCWEHNKCAIDDKMQDVYKQIDNADNIIIASPLYYSELSGSLLNFASRLQFLWVSKNFRKEQVLQDKNRKGIVLLACGGDGTTDKAFQTAKCLLSIMGAKFMDSAVSYYTNEIPAVNDKSAIEKIISISNLLNCEG